MRTEESNTSAHETRFVIGISLSDDLRSARAVLARGTGVRQQTSLDVCGAAVRAVPRALAGRIRQQQSGQSGSATPTSISPALTELAADLAQQILARGGGATHEVLAIGLHGFGTWHGARRQVRAYQSLCDTARLAELTGLSVIDDFPSRDLAQNGLGGPIEAHGHWLLLADRARLPGRRIRALARLSDTVCVTVLPPPDSRRGNVPYCCVGNGPGMRLLDELAKRLSRGSQSYDAGGHLAVQGRTISELFELWTRRSNCRQSEWHPQGVSATPLIYEAVDQAILNGWSVQDMLCTATHLVASNVASFVTKGVPPSQPVGELILAGGGRRNGLLLREIKHRLPGVQVCLIEDLGIQSEDLSPAAIAGLTFLHIDQVPVSPTSGTEAPRILGRLTPGSPTNWHRLLREMTRHVPPKMTLRTAI